MPSKEYLKAERSTPWREEIRKAIRNKDRTDMTRVVMKSVDPEVRSRNYQEVNLGLTVEQAVAEAQRCLDCVNPTCIDGCPVEINIPKFIKTLNAESFLKLQKH